VRRTTSILLLIAGFLIIGFTVGALWLWALSTEVMACEPEPVTANTPTGIAGCERWGDGIASHYGPGDGVAMNFCTWELRHSSGCGWVAIQSQQTGIVVTVEVVDFCDCYTGTSRERIVDLQYGVVEALGLNLEAGLYDVTVWREGASSNNPPAVLPDTAMEVHP
jgi:hypothetical protein